MREPTLLSRKESHLARHNYLVSEGNNRPLSSEATIPYHSFANSGVTPGRDLNSELALRGEVVETGETVRVAFISESQKFLDRAYNYWLDRNAIIP